MNMTITTDRLKHAASLLTEDESFGEKYFISRLAEFFPRHELEEFKSELFKMAQNREIRLVRCTLAYEKNKEMVKASEFTLPGISMVVHCVEFN